MKTLLTSLTVIVFTVTLINSNKPYERDWINAPTQNTMMPMENTK